MKKVHWGKVYNPKSSINIQLKKQPSTTLLSLLTTYYYYFLPPSLFHNINETYILFSFVIGSPHMNVSVPAHHTGSHTQFFLIGSHAGSHWLVPILVGSHTGWFPFSWFPHWLVEQYYRYMGTTQKMVTPTPIPTPTSISLWPRL